MGYTHFLSVRPITSLGSHCQVHARVSRKPKFIKLWPGENFRARNRFLTDTAVRMPTYSGTQLVANEPRLTRDHLSPDMRTYLLICYQLIIVPLFSLLRRILKKESQSLSHLLLRVQAPAELSASETYR